MATHYCFSERRIEEILYSVFAEPRGLQTQFRLRYAFICLLFRPPPPPGSRVETPVNTRRLFSVPLLTSVSGHGTTHASAHDYCKNRKPPTRTDVVQYRAHREPINYVNIYRKRNRALCFKT